MIDLERRQTGERITAMMANPWPLDSSFTSTGDEMRTV